MKKYLSCIVLIVLCVICAAVFYVNANDFENDNATSTSQSTVIDTVPDKEPPKPTIDLTGTIASEHLTNTNLRIEWSIYKLDNEPKLYLSAEVYLDTPDQITSATSGYISVNGVKQEITTSTLVGTSNLIATHSSIMDFNGDKSIQLDAYLNIPSTTLTGDRLDFLQASGTVFASESYMKMPKDKLLELNLISKFPELPSGDEVTSLCMVLNYLGHKIDKCDLSDLYLSKGPAHYTNIFVANAGNPKDTYNSYGCMPPVIVNAANKYIGINGGNFYAQDFSGINIDMLYYEVSRGNPVIVWACEDFDSTPSVFRTLVIDDKKTYLKSNINTLVLIGYDYGKNTVTLANPSGNIFDVDMDLFEQRYAQVGSYAVIIK